MVKISVNSVSSVVLFSAVSAISAVNNSASVFSVSSRIGSLDPRRVDSTVVNWFFLCVLCGFCYFVGIFVPDKSCNINQLFFDPIFLLSRASLNAYRNFVPSWGYRLGGDPLSGFGSRLGGRLGSSFLSWLGDWLGSGLGGGFGDNLGRGFGSKLGSGFGSSLLGCPLSNLGSRFGGWFPTRGFFK